MTILKNSGLFVLALLLLFTLTLTFSKSEVAAATDFSNKVVIDDWDILDGDTNPLSEDNPAFKGTSYQLSINWHLEATSPSIQAGDTFTINLPQNEDNGYWTAGDSEFENFTNSAGVIMGEWRIYNGKIEAVFGSNAEGLLSTIYGNFKTGKNALRNETIKEGIQNVTVGEISKQIAFKRDELKPVDPNNYKGSATASNSNISWYFWLNRNGAKQLSSAPFGENFTTLNNTYLEDTLLGGGRFKSVEIESLIFAPVDLVTMAASNYTTSGFWIKEGSGLTRVTQNVGESYEAFKARLQPFEFGVYVDQANVQTFVLNFGDIGNNNHKYPAGFAQTAAQLAIDKGLYEESDRQALEDYFAAVYGDDNVIDGHVASYYVKLNVDYNKIVVDTLKDNVGIFTANDDPEYLGAQRHLQANIGSVLTGIGGVILHDEVSNEPLTGATFKLQYLEDNEWKDYEAAGIMTTDGNGFSQTPILSDGTYRFVQLTTSSPEYILSISQGYDETVGTVISEQFSVSHTDTEGHIVFVSNAKRDDVDPIDPIDPTDPVDPADPSEQTDSKKPDDSVASDDSNNTNDSRDSDNDLDEIDKDLPKTGADLTGALILMIVAFSSLIGGCVLRKNY